MSKDYTPAQKQARELDFRILEYKDGEEWTQRFNDIDEYHENRLSVDFGDLYRNVEICFSEHMGNTINVEFFYELLKAIKAREIEKNYHAQTQEILHEDGTREKTHLVCDNCGCGKHSKLLIRCPRCGKLVCTYNCIAPGEIVCRECIDETEEEE